MKRLAITLFVSACLFSHHADARLGETKTQLDARFGPCIRSLPADRGEQMLQYQLKNLMVLITLVHGNSEMEIYAPLDARTPLSKSEIQSLLKVNSFGKQWAGITNIPAWYLGNSPDPRSWIAVATYFPKSAQMIAPGLAIMKAEYARRRGLMPTI
jgi:hypothetical protein